MRSIAIQSLYLPATESGAHGGEAVLLINLGSPASPSLEDVRQYLSTFLMDERVISIAPFWRRLLVNGIIVPRRAPYSAANYRKIWEPETQTFPLVRHSALIARALCDALLLPVALAMRYGQPSMEEALQRLYACGVRRVYVLPLYPQYARSSFETAVVHALETHQCLELEGMELISLPAFYSDEGYRRVLADSVRPYLEEPFDKLVVSMHGIPLSHLSGPCQRDNGNAQHCREHQHSPQEGETCYRLHCERSVEYLREYLGLNPKQIELVYQSRLGRHEWIKPYFATRVRQWAREGSERIVVVSPGFACDCLETLEEIQHEHRSTFLSRGGKSFVYVPCLNSTPAFVTALADIISKHRQQ